MILENIETSIMEFIKNNNITESVRLCLTENNCKELFRLLKANGTKPDINNSTPTVTVELADSNYIKFPINE